MANENLELEEKQLKEYNDTLTHYSFTAEGGGVAPVEGPSLEIKKAGIRLHFLRYALFHNSTKGDSETKPLVTAYHQGQKSDTIEEVIPTGAPKAEGFYYAKTHLNAGYVYIMDEGDPNLWYEYEVDDFGNLHSIYWESNKDAEGNYKDIRRAKGKVVTYKTFKQGTVLWIAYSPVQWSIDYHTLMRTNTERRKDRMVKLVCSGFEQEASSSENFVTPYNEMNGVFFSEQDHQPLWFEHKLEEVIANDKSSTKKDPQALKEDMFITLHDPVGCALDINHEVGQKSIEFRALVESIQTGQEPETIIESLMRKEMDISAISTDHQSLFSLALACYQIVYADKKTMEKYDGGEPSWHISDTHDPKGLAKQEEADRKRRENSRGKMGVYRNSYAELGSAMQTNRKRSSRIRTGYIGYGLDRAKVEGILGVEQREKLRKEVLDLRDILGNYLNKAYCKSFLDDYLDNIEAYKLDGMETMSMMIMNLFVSPYDIDNHLLLNKDRKTEDKWKTWIYELIDEKSVSSKVSNTGIKSKTPAYDKLDPLHALISSKLNLDETWKNQLGTEVKLASFINVQLDFLSKKVFEVKELDGKKLRSISDVKQFVVKKLQTKYAYKGTPIILLRKSEIYAQLDAFGYNIDKSYVKIAPYQGHKDFLRIYKSSKDVIVNIEGGKKMIDFPVKYDVELSQKDIKLNQLNQKAAKVLNSKAFTGTIAGLQMLNMYDALTSFDKKRKGKSVVNLAGVSADLTEAILNVQKARLLAQGVGQTGVKSLYRATKIFGAIGGAATSAICIWDAVDAFNKRDTDAGVAWAGAGVAYGVATVMTIFSSSIALAGPIGLIAAGVGLGLVVLANVLTDTDLEYYFKHFLLSDRLAFAMQANELPHSYAARLFENRKQLLGDDPEEDNVKRLMNPYDAQVQLFDLLVCTSMKFIPEKSQTTYSSSNAGMAMISYTHSTVKYYSFRIEMQFMQFLEIDSHIDHQAFLYVKGVKKGKPIFLSTIIERIHNNVEAAKELIIRFSIPKSYQKKVSPISDLLFAVRINGETKDKTVFPFNDKGEQRYMGTIADLGTFSPIFGLNQTEKIKIGNLEELKQAKTWQ